MPKPPPKTLPKGPTAPKPKRKPASAAELDALAQITPSDIARARAAWEQDAPAPLRKLLDATDDGSTPPKKAKRKATRKRPAT